MQKSFVILLSNQKQFNRWNLTVLHVFSNERSRVVRHLNCYNDIDSTLYLYREEERGGMSLCNTCTSMTELRDVVRDMDHRMVKMSNSGICDNSVDNGIPRLKSTSIRQILVDVCMLEVILL